MSAAPMKVWLVTQGSYSDYRVLAAFSSRALADACKELIRGDEFDSTDVEEFPLDPPEPPHPPGLFPYTVGMARDGRVGYAHRDSQAGFAELRKFDADGYMPQNFVILGDKDYTYGMSFTMWAADAEHAIKIANERRAALVASGLWDRTFEERRKVASWHRPGKVLPGEPEP